MGKTVKLPISNFLLDEPHAHADKLWGPYPSLAAATSAIPTAMKVASFKFGVLSNGVFSEYIYLEDNGTPQELASLKVQLLMNPASGAVAGKILSLDNELKPIWVDPSSTAERVSFDNSEEVFDEDVSTTQAAIEVLKNLLDALDGDVVKGILVNSSEVNIENGVASITIPDAITSVIANHELVLQTPDGQSVKGKVGVTTGADGIVLLTLTDGNGNVFSSMLPGLKIENNVLKYSDSVGTWHDGVTLGTLTIKGVSATDPVSGNLGDLVLVGSSNNYTLKVYDGEDWEPVGSINNVSLDAGYITFTPPPGMSATTVQDAIEEVNIVLNGDPNSDLDFGDDDGHVLARFSEGHVRTKEFDSRDVAKIKQNTGIAEYDEFDEETSYQAGDKVLYDGLLYVFVYPHSGAWSSNDVEQTTVLADADSPVEVEDDFGADLDFGDENRRVVLRVDGGHIQTKNFNSKQVIESINALNHVGRNAYVGRKIDIKTYAFDYELYLSAVAKYNDGNTDHAIQAMAIWNNVIFCFYDAGYCRTYDYETKELISAFATGAQVSTNHCGDAVFGNKYFDGNTDFPALYESGDLTNKCCYVMSMSGTSAVLKQKLNFITLSTYQKADGSAVKLDFARNRLIYMQRVKSNISDFTNEFDICEFEIPSLTDGVDDGNGVLVLDMTDAMVLDHYTLPYYPGIYQAGKIHNGQLLQTYGRITGNTLNSLGTREGLLVYDMTSSSHEVLSHINLTPLIDVEPEGIDIYNDKLYISFVDGNIYEFKL